MNFYEKFKAFVKRHKILYGTFRLAKKIVKIPVEFVMDLRASYYVKKRRTVRGKVKVAFIVQVPSIWDKTQPLYDEMCKNDAFEVSMLVVPTVNQSNFEKGSYEDNFFIKNYPDAIKIVEVLETKKISDFHFDYVFYPRPYEIWLPPELRAHNVMKFARCCYIPYGLKSNGNDWNLISRDFARSIHTFFASSQYEVQDMEKCFSRYYKNGANKCVFLGYPQVQSAMKAVSTKQPKPGILWTPRWTYDSVVGGSHFFEYRDSFLELAKKHTECRWSVRPHPLMFENFIGNGTMTREEVAEFKAELSRNGIFLDDASDAVEKIFCSTDVLITDFSSIMGPFFVMKKPIIYCVQNGIQISTLWEKLVQGMYVAQNWEQVQKHLEDILSGNDYMKEKREKIFSEEFAFYKNDVNKQIAGYILHDAGIKNQ